MAKFKSSTERAIDEAFQFFAENDELPLNHILPAIRALGLPVTMGQLKEVVTNDKCDLSRFKRILALLVEKRKPDTLNNEIRKAYEALKDNNGKVLKRYLKNLLQNTGEKLTNDEVLYLFTIYYLLFVVNCFYLK